MKRFSIFIIFSVISAINLAVFTNVWGTAGFAEWDLRTPGGNVIAHMDPWKADHGNCLKESQGDQVFVSQIIWWQYYDQYVIGQHNDDYFIFREDDQEIIALNSKSDLLTKLEVLRLRNPLSTKMTPQDGWSLNWEYSLAKIRLLESDLEPEMKVLLENMMIKYNQRVYDKDNVIYLINP